MGTLFGGVYYLLTNPFRMLEVDMLPPVAVEAFQDRKSYFKHVVARRFL